MLLRSDPFQDLDRLTQQMFGTPAAPGGMPIDAYRVGDEFIVELDLPGVNAETIDVTVEKRMLTITAERKRATTDGTQLLIGERPHGTFRRQLLLGDSLDVEHVAARYHDGVLTLSVPIAATAKARRVEIQHGENDALDAPSRELNDASS